VKIAAEKLRDADDLIEETLLSITPSLVMALLKPEVSTLWRAVRS